MRPFPLQKGAGSPIRVGLGIAIWRNDRIGFGCFLRKNFCSPHWMWWAVHAAGHTGVIGSHRRHGRITARGERRWASTRWTKNTLFLRAWLAINKTPSRRSKIKRNSEKIPSVLCEFLLRVGSKRERSFDNPLRIEFECLIFLVVLGYCLVFKKRLWSKKIQSDWRTKKKKQIQQGPDQYWIVDCSSRPVECLVDWKDTEKEVFTEVDLFD